MDEIAVNGAHQRAGVRDERFWISPRKGLRRMESPGDAERRNTGLGRLAEVAERIRDKKAIQCDRAVLLPRHFYFFDLAPVDVAAHDIGESIADILSPEVFADGLGPAGRDDEQSVAVREVAHGGNNARDRRRLENMLPIVAPEILVRA